MIGMMSILYLSPIVGLGFAEEFKLYNNKVCISYNNTTYNSKYSFSERKINSDVFDISKAFIDYFKIHNRNDCILNCNLNINLVTSSYLTSNFSNWTTGAVKDGNYTIYNSNSNTVLTGLYTYDPYVFRHTIYITDTNSDYYNYGILSHELAHYWFKRKCFNEGYYNEYYAIMFHQYFMKNYTGLINNSLLYGDKK